MVDNYSDVFQDRSAVDKYQDRTYARGTYSSIVSARQASWLRSFIREAFPDPPVHYDFACGTGRAARMVDGTVAVTHGYDPSHAMLAKARDLGTPGHLHHIDPVGPVPELDMDPQRHNLVTAFRLLLNVEESVRDRFMEFASAALPKAESGLLVVENHGNASSIRRLRRTFGRLDTNSWFQELSHREVEELFDHHGFELVGIHGFTLFTQGFYRQPLKFVARPTDAVLCSLIGRWCTNVVYVGRRK
ncbi:methyltransferase domain-containing protein [Haloglycomyces albus]|uniref:methyltransferase domain-containing protein n=1 Tax=Haloglycomyces albus TaxID=526067 RepID=UPI00046CFE2A|nr:methyltransferase domain-containing protein [Haloglycomyces albus]